MFFLHFNGLWIHMSSLKKKEVGLRANLLAKVQYTRATGNFFFFLVILIFILFNLQKTSKWKQYKNRRSAELPGAQKSTITGRCSAPKLNK